MRINPEYPIPTTFSLETKSYNILFLFLILVTLPVTIRASGTEPDIEYWKGYLSNTKDIITAPSRWERKDWLKTLCITGSSIGLYVLDDDINNFFNEHNNSSILKASKFAKPFGDLKYTIPGLAALYLYGKISENNRLCRTTLISLESLLISSGFTLIIKLSTHRHRPKTEVLSTRWDGPGIKFAHLSFPSGHTSSAFSLLTAFASEYDQNVFLPISCYSLAAITAISRLYDNEHWASDVFIGAVIGYFTARAIVEFEHEDVQAADLSPYRNNNPFAIEILQFKF